MSKGSRRRPTNESKFRENHERIFGEKPIKVWKLARKRVPEKNPKISTKNA